jgi:5'-nucleotidase
VDAYEHRADPRQRDYYWLSGVQDYCYPPEFETSDDDDLAAVKAGWVSVTPLRFDLNCDEEKERLDALDLDVHGGGDG